MGYSNLRYYSGGLADWVKGGGAVARNATPAVTTRSRLGRGLSGLELLAQWPLDRLVGCWFGMIVVFGLMYWITGVGMGWGLQAGNAAVMTDLNGLATAIYFSFVTALSIGYGDVIPTGALRVLAVIEGIGGLLIFGCVISKLVSRRQEELTEEIHRTTFEDRLDRVRTNLHLVFSELEAVRRPPAEQGAITGSAIRRLESTLRVFRGELQTIHDLLYQSPMEAGEEALDALLASLLICLQSLVEVHALRGASPGRSATFEPALRAIATLAQEICGECVPRRHAPALMESMDRVRELARRLA